MTFESALVPPVQFYAEQAITAMFEYVDVHSMQAAISGHALAPAAP